MYGVFITLPTDFASSTLGVSGPVISDFAPFIEVVSGVLLAVTAIAILIRVLRH